MSHTPVKKEKCACSPMQTIVWVTLAIILGFVLIWHVLLPMLGITIAAAVITASIWNVAIATIVIICVSTLLFFLFTGIGMMLLAIGVFVWTIVAIALFPLLFPIVLPALLLMLAICFILKKK